MIGSKRHPESHVHYPRSRRVGSWLYQQLVRLLFRLDVRDTQVGLKVFRREVAEEVLPLLLVKQFAFDLEFLAVARALGYGRIREQPVRLEYRFTGSGVRSVGGAARAHRHGGDLLPAPDPPLLPAQARAAAGVRARRTSYRPRVTLVASGDAGTAGLSGARRPYARRRDARGATRGGRERPRASSSPSSSAGAAPGAELAREHGAVPRQPTRSPRS